MKDFIPYIIIYILGVGCGVLFSLDIAYDYQKDCDCKEIYYIPEYKACIGCEPEPIDDCDE